MWKILLVFQRVIVQKKISGKCWGEIESCVEKIVSPSRYIAEHPECTRPIISMLEETSVWFKIEIADLSFFLESTPDSTNYISNRIEVLLLIASQCIGHSSGVMTTKQSIINYIVWRSWPLCSFPFRHGLFFCLTD